MQRAKIVGAVLLALVCAAAWPNAQGGGRAGGAGVKHPNGTLTPIPLDAGRPWGWAAKAFMQNPKRKLYNTAKAKLFSGQQVFSHTQSQFNPEQVLPDGATLRFHLVRDAALAVAVRRG